MGSPQSRAVAFGHRHSRQPVFSYRSSLLVGPDPSGQYRSRSPREESHQARLTVPTAGRILHDPGGYVHPAIDISTDDDGRQPPSGDGQIGREGRKPNATARARIADKELMDRCCVVTVGGAEVRQRTHRSRDSNLMNMLERDRAPEHLPFVEWRGGNGVEGSSTAGRYTGGMMREGATWPAASLHCLRRGRISSAWYFTARSILGDRRRLLRRRSKSRPSLAGDDLPRGELLEALSAELETVAGGLDARRKGRGDALRAPSKRAALCNPDILACY